MTICYKQRVQLSVTLQLQVPNVTNNQPGNNRITENVIGYPGSTKKAGGVYGEKKAENEETGSWRILVRVYNGYVNRARSAVFYEKGHRIAEAFKICEAEHGLSGEFDKREMAEEIGNIMKKPNDPDSPLYLYVGEDTDDCTDFTLSFKNTGDGKMEINGFTYTADTYEIRWTEDDGVKVTME